MYLAQGTVNISATYSTRHHDIESSVVARGDLWRLESSRGSLNSGNDTSPLFLIQLGPLLFVRDSTLLLPVHLSKQHLLWYGYDRKVLVPPSFDLMLFEITCLFKLYYSTTCLMKTSTCLIIIDHDSMNLWMKFMVIFF